MLAVFVIGLSATWLPPIPRLVTSPVGPALGAIGEPVSIEVPSVKIKAPVVPIELEGDVLNPPADVKKVGWWQRSAQPGATDGQSLLTGHAVHTGGGVMNRLGDVKRGASVTIRSKDKSASFIVQRVFVWSKEDVAEHSEDLFEPDIHGRRLVLVTCADWDGTGWDSNVIVFAQPV
jgi:LPXTG-site transpeptidase (sortase) family protein